MTALCVECEQDGEGRSAPARFRSGAGPWLRVAEVLDRWEGEDHRYYRVRTDDGARWILRWDAGRDAWEIQLFECGANGDILAHAELAGTSAKRKR